MNHNVDPLARLILFCLLIAVAIVPLYIYSRRRLSFSREKSYLFTIITGLLTLAALFLLGDHTSLGTRDSVNPDHLALIAGSIAGLVLTGLPLFLKFYQAWIQGQVTDAEKKPGTPGFRAWFSLGHLILAVIFSFSVSTLFECSLIETLGLTLLALAAFPIFSTLNSMNSSTPSSNQPPETSNAEREKILAMVESNKITAEEGVELLNALGASWDSRTSRNSTPQPQIRGATLIGAILGFFLPWFTIDVNKLAEEAGSQFGNSLQGSPFGGMAQNFIGNMSQAMPQVTVKLAGGDLQHGLGWLVLLLSVAVAVLPFVVAHLQIEIQQRIELGALAIGAFLLLYLCSDYWRFISIGFILVAAGYFIQVANAITRLRGLRAIGNLAHDHA